MGTPKSDAAVKSRLNRALYDRSCYLTDHFYRNTLFSLCFFHPKPEESLCHSRTKHNQRNDTS